MTWAEMVTALQQAQEIARRIGGKVEPVALGWNEREEWWLGKVQVSVPAERKTEG